MKTWHRDLARTTPHAILVLALIWVGSLASKTVALETDQLIRQTQAFLCHPSGLNGDTRTRVSLCLDTAKASPDSPVAELALRVAGDTLNADLVIDPAWLVQLDQLLACPDLRPGAIEQARLFKATLLRMKGDFTTAALDVAAAGCITSWKVIGPFGRWGGASFFVSFEPEAGQGQEEASYPGALGPVSWQPLLADPFNGNLYPFRELFPRADGVAYMKSEIVAKTTGLVALKVVMGASWALWVNNEEVVQCDRLSVYQSRELTIPVYLSAGKNQVLLKVYSGGRSISANVFLLSLDGEPLDASKPVLPSESIGTNAGGIQKGQRERVNVGIAQEPKCLVAYRTALSSSEGSSALHGALALLYGALGLYDHARQEAGKGLALAGNNATYALLAAQAEEGAYHLPREIRTNRSRRLYRRSLKLNPNCLPALLALSRLELDDEQPREALTLLDKALAAAPNNRRVQRRRVEVALDQGWTGEAKGWLEKMRPKADESMPVSFYLISARLALHERREVDVTNNYQAALNSDASQLRIWLALLKNLQRTGQEKAAGKVLSRLLKIAPEEPRLRLEAATQAIAFGHPKAALKYIKRARKIRPKDESIWRWEGDLLLELGRREEALAPFFKSLELDPSQHRLRELVADLSGKQYDFWSPYAFSTKKSLKEAKHAQHFGATVRLIDQSIMTLYRDGSRAEIVHELQKVLNKHGVQEASRVPIYGELLTAHTILPGGQVRQPIRLKGQEAFTMPYLYPGGAVEYRFLSHYRRPNNGLFYGPGFFFRSPDQHESFVVSDYIVRVEDGLSFRYVQRNFTLPPKVTREDGVVTYRWTLRNTARVANESYGAHINEYLPFVEIGSPIAWEEVARLFSDEVLGRLRPTLELKTLVAGLTSGIPTEEEKARRLIRHVLDEVEQKSLGASAATIYARRSGERNVLLLTLLRMAGLDARYSALRPSRDWLYDANWELPRTTHLPERAIALFLKGREEPVWLDLRFRCTSFGEILEDRRGATALVVSGTGGDFYTLPKPGLTDYRTRSDLTFTVGASGQARIQGEFLTPGKAGAVLKEGIRALPQRDRVRRAERRLGAFLPGISVEALSYPDMNTPTSKYCEKLTCTVDRLLVPVGKKRYSLPLGINALVLYDDLDEDPNLRQNPCRSRAFQVGTNIVRFILPPGSRVEQLPKRVVLKDSFGSYHLSFSTGPGWVTLKRSYSFTPQFIPVADFSRYLTMARKVHALDRQQLMVILP